MKKTSVVIFGSNIYLNKKRITKELDKYKFNKIICFCNGSMEDMLREYAAKRKADIIAVKPGSSPVDDAIFTAYLKESNYWFFLIGLNDTPLRFRGLTLALQNLYAKEKLKTIII